MHVALEEGDQVRARLADDEVVDVEELGDALEGRFSLGVCGVGPVPEVDCVGRLPGNDVALGVLAQNLGLSIAIKRRG